MGAPKTVQAPQDALTANNWILEIQGSSLKSPNFSKLDGLSREVEMITNTDGGSGHTYNFHGGIIKYGNITITRIKDGSSDDEGMKKIVSQFHEDGRKANGTFIKYHHGKIVEKINFLGLCFPKEALASMDNKSANPYETTYEATVDYWEHEKV